MDKTLSDFLWGSTKQEIGFFYKLGVGVYMVYKAGFDKWRESV